MKTLVIGATGFIGQHLVDALGAAGHGVRVLARKPEAAQDLAARGAEVCAGDVRDAESIERAAKGVEVVYNLAGSNETLLARKDPHGDGIFETNCLGNVHSARAALATGARRLVTVSSVYVFGHEPGQPVDEEHLPNLWRYAGPYLFSRVQQELHVLRYAARGLEVIIVNPGFIVGSKDRGPNFPGQVILAFLRRKLPLLPPGGTSWIGVGDVAAGLLGAATRGRSGERYIFTSEHLSFRDLAERIERVTGVRTPRRTLPRTLARSGAALGKAVTALFGRRPAVDPVIGLGMLADGFYYSADKAARELGLPRHPIDRDLAAAYEDFQARGLVKAAR